MTDASKFTHEQQVAIARALPRIAKILDRELARAGAPRMPWSLFTWGGNRGQYISNSNREEIKLALRETLDRWEKPLDPPLAGGFQ